MNAFLRKHGKWILAVLGVVLMFLWVLPNRQNQQGVRENTVVGKAGDTTIMSDDLLRSENEIKLMHDIAGKAAMHTPDDGSNYHPYNEVIGRFAVLAQNAKLHYLLLQIEAKEQGISVSAGEAQAFQDAQLHLTPDDIQILSQAYQLSNGVVPAIQHYLEVKKLCDWSQETVAVSAPEVAHLIVDQSSQVKMAYAALDANNLVQAIPSPAKADIEKQFETYKEILPDDAKSKPQEIAGHKYPFGYKLPDRVGIEYMIIKFADARRISEPGTPDEKVNDQMDAFRDFRADYNAGKLTETPATTSAPATATAPATSTAPATATAPANTAAATKAATATAAATMPATLSATAPTTATAPASAPAPKKMSAAEIKADMEKKWAENRQKYLDMQIDKRAKAKVKEIAEHAAARSRQVWEEEPTSNYKKDLDPKSWVSYADIAKEIGQRYNVTVEAKTARSPAGKTLLNQKEVAGIDLLGKAIFKRLTGETFDLESLAMHVRQLDPNNKGVAAQLLLQVGVDGPVLVDPTENPDAYVYRITAADAAHVPTKEDEVKDAYQFAQDDLKRVLLFSRLKSEGSDIEQAAVTKGLTLAAKEKNLDVQLTPFFTRVLLQDRSGILPEVRSPEIDEKLGVLPAFSDKAFELAWNYPARISGATSQPAGMIATTPVGTVAVEEKLTVYVMQLDSYKPVTHSDFENIQKYGFQQYGYRNIFVPVALTSARQQTFLRDWMSINQIAKRLGYKTKDGKDYDGGD